MTIRTLIATAAVESAHWELPTGLMRNGAIGRPTPPILIPLPRTLTPIRAIPRRVTMPRRAITPRRVGS